MWIWLGRLRGGFGELRGYWDVRGMKGGGLEEGRRNELSIE